jgi:hypothetical protein
MSTNVTLEIPEQLYERARQVAQDQHRDVSAVVAQVLENGLPAIESDGSSPEIKQEIAAFHRLHPKLWSNYPGEYAAVFKEELVDHDADRAALLQRIEINFPNDFVLVRPILEEPEITYHNRSIRWAD